MWIMLNKQCGIDLGCPLQMNMWNTPLEHLQLLQARAMWCPVQYTYCVESLQPVLRTKTEHDDNVVSAGLRAVYVMHSNAVQNIYC